MALLTDTSNYAHTICGACGTVLHCSEVEPWENYGTPTDMGWCPHLTDDEGCPVVAAIHPPGPSDWHLCEPSPAGRQGAGGS
jgi:hypothetical protein